ncbi:hypothetical protein [Humidesulfovibrio idahonensis]
MTAPCAFHDQSMEQVRSTLVDIREQMREGLAALKEQADLFRDTIAKVVDAQSARRELCAKQDQRLVSLEQAQTQHREAHAIEREEYLQDRADSWSAVNKLRFHVYMGLGGFAILEIVVLPIVLHYVLR